MNQKRTSTGAVVTDDTCIKRRKGIWQFIGAVLSLIIIGMAMVGYSIKDSRAASAAARDVAETLKIHEAKQSGTLQTIDHRLSSIDGNQKELKAELKEQRNLIEQLLRKVDP
jgi:peptidoglycan hydrolase CwlO-like protein